MDVEDLYRILGELIEAGRGEESIYVSAISELGEDLTAIDVGEVGPVKMYFGYAHYETRSS